MNQDPDDEYDDQYPLDMTNAEFAEWIKDPVNLRKILNHMKNVLGGEYPESTPEMIEGAKLALAKRREMEMLELVRRKRIQFDELMSQFMVRSPREVLEEGKLLVEEVTDAMLDVPEPNRTLIMNVLLSMREQLEIIEGSL